MRKERGPEVYLPNPYETGCTSQRMSSPYDSGQVFVDGFTPRRMTGGLTGAHPNINAALSA